MKTCSKCGVEKSLDGFHVDKRYHLGVKGVCKVCVAVDQTRRRAAARKPRPPKIVDGTKQCSQCGEWLPTDVFSTNNRAATGLNSRCRECIKDKRGAMIERDPTFRDRSAAYFAARRGSRHQRSIMLRHKYGIDMDDYDRMLEEQGGTCAICDDAIDDRYLDVDHCHTTLVVRGLLCRSCNMGVGYFKDDPDRLIAAAFYLLQSRGEICV